MAGFTLLEAIVALVILSIGALALYGWLSTNMIALERVRARQEQEIVARSSLDLVRRLNPMETPTGERRVDDLIVKWSGEVLEGPKPGVMQSGGTSIFNVGLYLLDVRVTRDGEVVHAFKVRQVGWKQVRKVDL
ncbi:hypothetical protein GCM10010080_26590 [Thermomonas carbonis]|uniref:PulJ/GspJ family protein n=1 Tax=Thermomonas carbonis TaxID=1463158 RepID=UPI001674185F|nr:type II secretion system protein [Thermomonas carbonis]GHC09889.1 hypothetical protein GCM10010080_26590 [Thermomonas carbonis]